MKFLTVFQAQSFSKSVKVMIYLGFQAENAEIKVIFIRNDTETYFVQNYAKPEGICRGIN